MIHARIDLHHTICICSPKVNALKQPITVSVQVDLEVTRCRVPDRGAADIRRRLARARLRALIGKEECRGDGDD